MTMPDNITDEGRELVTRGRNEKLEQVECEDCGELVYASKDERYITCSDHS